MAVGQVDYFAFFNLPRQVNVDESAVKKQFYQNTRDFHPDLYEGSPEEAMRLTSENNEAYKVMINLEKRIEHLLQLEGKWDEKSSVPQMFLLEMMDLNEEVASVSADGPDSPRGETVLLEIKTLRNSLTKELDTYAQQWDEEGSEMALDGLKDSLLKLRYVKRLEDNLSNLSPEV